LRGEDRQDFETALNVVIDRTDQLNVFMRNFADVFRLPPPNRQLCDMRSLIEDAAFLFKTECARRRIEIVWDAQTELEPVRSDRSQMEQVFVNVLKNAIEAINGAGKITIRLGKQAGRSFVVVEDTGCGIAPAARANLFTPFFSTKDNGQGIGLTLVQEILDQHGFEFSLESQSGQPTEFTVYF
jgi:signal transduction histidine kinase